MHRTTSNGLGILLAAAAWTGAGMLPVSDAAAQGGYPSKPIRLIVPYPPGGSTDFTAREVAQKLIEAWGQQVVIDNRPGAGSTIGHGIAAKSVADGYTLLLGTSAGLVVAPALGVKVQYDPQKDFAPVGLSVYAPFAMTVHPSIAATGTKEFIDLAKAQPGKILFSSPGTGTPNHLGGELLMAMAGIRMVHVPYKGGGPALTDLIAGQVHLMFSGIPQIQQHVKSGRLKAIAIGHPTRSKVWPELPAVAETLPGFNNTTWYGLLAPVGTPKAIVDRVNAEMNRALVQPEFAARMVVQGVEPATSTPDGFRDMIRREGERWRKVIREAGVRADAAQ